MSVVVWGFGLGQALMRTHFLFLFLFCLPFVLDAPNWCLIWWIGCEFSLDFEGCLKKVRIFLTQVNLWVWGVCFPSVWDSAQSLWIGHKSEHKRRSLQLVIEGYFIMEHVIGGKFKLGRKIGSGSFGELYLGMLMFLFPFVLFWCVLL